MLWTLILSVFLSGVSLSMDAFAVSVCDGMVYRNVTKRKAVLIPLTFGIFQAVMPIIGFYISMAFRQIEVFDSIDHWIAFALLLIIGGKMIFDGAKDLRKKEDEELKPKNFFNGKCSCSGRGNQYRRALCRFRAQRNARRRSSEHSIMGMDKRCNNWSNNFRNISYRRTYRRKCGETL